MCLLILQMLTYKCGWLSWFCGLLFCVHETFCKFLPWVLEKVWLFASSCFLFLKYGTYCGTETAEILMWLHLVWFILQNESLPDSISATQVLGLEKTDSSRNWVLEYNMHPNFEGWCFGIWVNVVHVRYKFDGIF
jgi:hypothetical protein